MVNTSPPNHNISLVTASPTRHPGPLYTACRRRRREKRENNKIKKNAEAARTRAGKHISVRIKAVSRVGGGFRESGSSTSLAEGPVSQPRSRLRRASCCQHDWSWKSHAACSARACVYPKAPAQLWKHQYYMTPLFSMLFFRRPGTHYSAQPYLYTNMLCSAFLGVFAFYL